MASPRNEGSVGATRVGVHVTPGYQPKRTCYRCGRECKVSGRTPKDKPYMCGDCKGVDHAMARRLGIANRINTGRFRKQEDQAS
jgi:hypothetical protein